LPEKGFPKKKKEGLCGRAKKLHATQNKNLTINRGRPWTCKDGAFSSGRGGVNKGGGRKSVTAGEKDWRSSRAGGWEVYSYFCAIDVFHR